ncbi:MAG: HNH endonuclease [Halomonas sp.]|nr:HNH endonuclease [Halomonas sp.]MBR2512770.1 HNH endonuclease [Halomonas sp.]
MKYWWVNQNQTYKQEILGGYLWSPTKNANGARNRFYDAMTETAVGDLVFSFRNTQIQAIGVVVEECQLHPKPEEFGTAGANWDNEGWLVRVDYSELNHPIRPKDHIDFLRPLLPSKYSPLQANGNGLQSVYLAPVPLGLAQALIELLDDQVEEVLYAYMNQARLSENQSEKNKFSNTSLPPVSTDSEKIVKIRVGQSIFRMRVAQLEEKCRITGVNDPRFLRASHIKPWAHSDNFERLDGNNGLFLSPHVDLLFDKGFISFSDDGSILISPQLPQDVVSTWQILSNLQPQSFNPEQAKYMAYHRKEIYLP